MKTSSKITGFATLALFAAMSLSSCELEYFQEELYRKEIFLVSGENNIAGQEFEYGGDEGILAIYASGTTPVDEDVTVNLALDYQAIGEYNQRNFDTQFDEYAMELPAENYSIDPMSVQIKAGNCEARCPIHVNVDNLLPDETYFIPLRIASVSNYMASLTKNYILFEIFSKNDYATTKEDTYYTMTGTSQDGWVIDNIFGSDVKRQAINSSKQVLPLDKYSIRMLPAAKVLDDKNEIRKASIRVTVHPGSWVNVPVYSEGVLTDEVQVMQKVTLEPYLDSNDALSVIPSPDNVCSYDPQTETFYLYYCYKLSTETVWHEVRETMTRAQY